MSEREREMGTELNVLTTSDVWQQFAGHTVFDGPLRTKLLTGTFL